MTIITISRQIGSGGEEIAEKICQALNYHPFGKAEITQAAFEAGLSESENLDFSEDNYKVKSFLDRLFKRSVTVAQIKVMKEDASGKRCVDCIDVDEASALALIQKAIKIAYQADRMVIVGRGGQIILKRLANTLHVRIEADMEERIQRIQSQLTQKGDPSGKNQAAVLRREAENIIRERDRASAGYIRQFYGYDWADAALYDLVINTSQTGIEGAVQSILEKVQTPQKTH
jgi:cytidylate kinase